MKKRKDTLEKLKKSIIEEGTAKCYYYDSHNDCYCAIGHILKNENFDFNKINPNLNGARVPMFIDACKEADDVLTDSGLTMGELKDIQVFNDCRSEEELLEYIDNLLEAENGKANKEI